MFLCVLFIPQVDSHKHTMSKYLMELTLPEYAFVPYDPSEIAAAALCLSSQMIEPDTEWVSYIKWFIHLLCFSFTNIYFQVVDEDFKLHARKESNFVILSKELNQCSLVVQCWKVSKGSMDKWNTW